MFFHHVSIIDKETFDSIKSGIKRIKFYLNDAKRNGLKVGDFICYINADTREEIVVSVKKYSICKGFKVAGQSITFEFRNSWLYR